MTATYRIQINIGAVTGQIERNRHAALEAAALDCVGKVVEQMADGYDHPVYDTGTLMGDVQYDFENEQTVAVGNTKDYAVYVHEGHNGHAVYLGDSIGFRVMPGGHTAGRPYIRDAIMGSQDEIKATLEEYLQRGFNA